MMIRINILGDEPETEAFGTACQRLLRWGKDINVDLHVEKRKPDGWLEYLIVIFGADGRRIITIGMIQRTPGGAWEFHS